MGGSIQKGPLNLTGTATLLAGQAYEGIGGATDGVGSNAKFATIGELTTDGTHLYTNNGASIVKIAIATGEVTTIAGNYMMEGSVDGIGLEARFENLKAITNTGTHLYTYARGNLRQVELSSAKVTTIDTGLGNVPGITTDNQLLYFADHNKPYGPIFGLNPTTQQKSVIRDADIPATPESIYSVGGPITTDGTYLYIFNGASTSSTTSMVKVHKSTGDVSTFAFNAIRKCPETPIDGVGGDAYYCEHFQLTSDGTNLYALDRVQNKSFIRKIVIATGEVSTLSISGPDPSFLMRGITTDGKSLFVTGGRQIWRID